MHLYTYIHTLPSTGEMMLVTLQLVDSGLQELYESITADGSHSTQQEDLRRHPGDIHTCISIYIHTDMHIYACMHSLIYALLHIMCSYIYIHTDGDGGRYVFAPTKSPVLIDKLLFHADICGLTVALADGIGIKASLFGQPAAVEAGLNSSLVSIRAYAHLCHVYCMYAYKCIAHTPVQRWIDVASEAASDGHLHLYVRRLGPGRFVHDFFEMPSVAGVYISP